MNKVAISYTIKNEADLIVQNINFHKKLGIEHFFVFLDDNTDNSLELVQDLEGISIRESISPDEFNDSYINTKFLGLRDNHDARRVYNSSLAAKEAVALGFDWLICIDADELILCDFNSLEEAQINSKLTQVNNAINQVVFKTYEQLPVFKKSCDSFKTQDCFLDKDKSNIKRELYDPFTKTNIPIGRKFFGHDSGKTAFRLSELNDYYPMTHRWLSRADNSPGNFIEIDSLLHYYFYSFKKFKQRFINYQNRSELSIGNYKYPEHILKLIEFSKTMSDKEFQEYYKEHICNENQSNTFNSEGIIKPKVLEHLF